MILPLTATANALIAVSFFAISGLIVAGLLKDRSLGVNPLGVATAMVFLTCASGHAMHAEHYFAEAIDLTSDHWDMLFVDGLTLAAGLTYLAQRRRYGLVIRGSHPLIDYQRRLEMSEALRDISQDIAAQTDFETLLLRVVHHTRDLLQADYAAIVTVDESGKSYCHFTGTKTGGWDEEAWSRAVFLPDLIKAAAEKSPRHFLLVDDLERLAVSPADRPEVHDAEGGRSILAVAIRQEDMVSGALMVACRRPGRLAKDDVASASALAGQAAIAIDKARLIETLRQSDRMKIEFITAAAHELKTPVTAIKGWAELLLRPGGAGPGERKALETIRGQADRMTRLSEDLLAMMQVEPSFDRLAKEPCDLSALAGLAIEHARRLDHSREFRFRTTGPLVIEGDPRRIVEMLGRLLENATRYSPAGKPIEVETFRNGTEGVASVSDHGPGIPVDRQAHVFEPFYEPIPPGEAGYVGIVSLRLHVSKQIAEAHGGRIWVSSTPGEGSTFYVGLPLQRAGGDYSGS